ncbi:MAG: hypothetical protein IJV76_10665 [Clostridia bacterium]|nr:hypothetical protein [Clostridia bacterium]
MKKSTRAAAILAYIAAVLIFLGVVYYVTLPPISIYSGAFWTFFFFLDAVVFVSFLVIGTLSGKLFGTFMRLPSGHIDIQSGVLKRLRFVKIQAIFTLIVAAFLGLGSLVSSEMFRAKT